MKKYLKSLKQEVISPEEQEKYVKKLLKEVRYSFCQKF